ncbi:TIGR03750 family conjugal transfer protein [Legionella maceachernii]|uniref:TIGR03750 family conjugal transfer protein n=1 Tax=Legionella maceachernii TaxID=466 RepID=UPI00099945DE|nr:TIGR03750 family conjugal transfer protein [Legionella maceachernii]SKA18419.1 conjugative transfer region protein, TIGR03750 family [Legionella maceachernii]SUP04514.1 conjugative transfer region protein [Legionella maceachernii]
MNQPSSRHLTYDYEAYKGLSLKELFWIVVVTTPLTSLVFALVGLNWGFSLALSCIGFLLGFVLAITVCPKQIARLKTGKPKCYLAKKIRIKLSRWGICRRVYLNYQGLWQITKTLGE